MLRTSLRSVRVLGRRPIAAASGHPWPTAASRQTSFLGRGQRFYADEKKPATDASKPAVLPSSETLSSERSDSIPAEPPIQVKVPPVTSSEIPLTPPEPPTATGTTGKIPSPATTTIDDVGESQVLAESAPAPAPPPPPPPPKRKGFFRRLRNFLFTLIVLGAVGFSGGVWYSRINDNFHDFFTEYIPYGEQAVLYFEELEFKKKFPKAIGRSSSPNPRLATEHVKIPAQNGASWRVADGEGGSRQSSAASDAKKAQAPAPERKTQPDEPGKAEAPKPAALNTTAPVEKTVESTSPVVENPKEAVRDQGFKAPEVNEPSKFPPLKPIDLMELPDAKEPLVRDIVHTLNDIILVINADGAHGKYASTIDKAKKEVSQVGGKLRNVKAEVEKKAANEVRFKVAEFEEAASKLIERVEQSMITKEVLLQKEFEKESQDIQKFYEERIKLLLEREHKVHSEQLQNELLKQAVALKKEFVQDVKARVEEEREGRLGKLNELTAAVSELEKLATGWNNVIDTNLKTQQLHVAVEAVRARLQNAEHPQPFVQELVALKEIASDDPVVDAAIASVNPSAYQRGVSPAAHLIDRFRKVASEVRKASLLPEEAGVASHASSWVLSHVMFKKQGLAEGDDVESILTRTQTYLEEGDLDAAAREMNGLDGWAKTLSKDWLGEVRKVLEVQQALDSFEKQLLVGQAITDMQPSARRLVVAIRTGRGYSEALQKLSELQSNRSTTQLFDGTPKPDLNAAALPEMGAWLRRAGYDADALARIRHIHVAGTKGKGSVCAQATALLEQHGAVGTYTSPHLVSPRERIAIGGKPVGQGVFARAFFEIWDRFTEAASREGARAEEAESAATKPFYFRFLTILAWHIFLTRNIRTVVMECGIGGEYDATNILPAQAVSAAVISQLGVDHVAMLGDTVEQIAWHKAGIIKPGIRAFTRKLDDQPRVMEVLRRRAAERGGELVEVPDDLVRSWGGVQGGLRGDFQKYNQALAMLAVREHLGLDSSPLASLRKVPKATEASLRSAKLRGRCEVLSDGYVKWHLDGAHTKDSLEEVARWFAGELGAEEQAVLVFNQQERDASELLAGFLDALKRLTGRGDVFLHAVFTTNDVGKPVAGEDRDVAVQDKTARVMESMMPGCTTAVKDNIRDAVTEVRMQTTWGCKKPKALVTGSLHLVGGVLRVLEPDSLL
ncbi:hypothetical protein S7711_04256 [Stachybotrys chartarum IBT 7711]|uniref:MICOS complex subunit MIC60 n=1 Tax=Stachybotrys chartarum (strain CBS 109288 / IBT 7711) TaxID=1280523 RepID=A0A084AIN6_STACB|nr:hypothetical protein S7711_04256 [Stachybotrys chartarum IBT 7711]